MKQVLYVEDSTTAQLLMRKFLGNLCELTVTSSLRKGEAAFAERKFDLVIADYLFPEGDALDFIHHVRRAGPPQELPLIVVSGAMDRVMMSQVMRAGANDAFAKPLDPPGFRGSVERMLAKPYVRTLLHTSTAVRCFQWIDRNQIFQYCPELQITVSGTTRDEAGKKMLEALRQRAADGVALGLIGHEKIVTHVIES